MDNAATSGSPTARRGVPVRRVTVNSTGASSTSPTWKKTGRPMMNPDSISAHPTRRSPNAPTRAFETTTAPPDSARSLPMTVPSAITIATNPRVSPTPAWNARGISRSGIRAATPTHSEARVRATKAGIRAQVTRITTSATPAAATSRRRSGSAGLICGRSLPEQGAKVPRCQSGLGAKLPPSGGRWSVRK